MLKTKKGFIILLAILIQGLILSFNLGVSIEIEEETPLLYVDPSTVLDVPPSESFTINVKIADISNLYGFDIMLQWDSDLLDYVGHVVKVPVEDYPDGVLYKPVIPVDDTVDEAAGTYSVAYACMDPAPVFDGSGTIFNMTFHVKGLGECLLDIYYSKFVDKSGVDIISDVQDGYFRNYVPVPAQIYVSPEEIIDSTIVPCNNFTIDVNLEQAVDLYAFQFQLDYNTTILDTANVTVDSTFTLVEVTISEPQGWIRVNGSLEPPSPSIGGNLILSSITFHTTGVGETILDLHNVTLLNPSSEIIDCEPPTDGYFNNMLEPKMYVHPEELIAPGLKPGSEFNISIKIEETVGLYGYRFNLTYDIGILNCLGVIIVPPNNGTYFTTEISCIDGAVWVNVTYYPPAEPITIMSPKTVANIYFQVKNYGCTDLDLDDTEIPNQYGQPIFHNVGDGYFCTLIRDVAIIKVQPHINATYPKRMVDITVVASNLGDFAETFNVTVYYDSTIIGTQTVADLAPHENITLAFIWDTTGVEPCYTYVTSAEASQVPYEINLENNVYIGGSVKIKILGDVNGDGVVDIADLVLITAIYRCTEDDPEWNPQADLAPLYGMIDIVDIVTASGRYGQSCSS
jgi:hypothetical protein